MGADDRRGRRTFLAGAAALFGASLAFFRKARAEIRPPGALPEKEFTSACIRCFRCAEVCPVQAILPSTKLHPTEFETPIIRPRERACILCMKCTNVCPTGALQPIEARAETIKDRVAMGMAVVDRKRCITWNRSGSCKLCYYVCPYPGSAVKLVGFVQGPHFSDQCVGCGLCEEACPSSAEAISVVPREDLG